MDYNISENLSNVSGQAAQALEQLPAPQLPAIPPSGVVPDLASQAAFWLNTALSTPFFTPFIISMVLLFAAIALIAIFRKKISSALYAVITAAIVLFLVGITLFFALKGFGIL